MLKEGYFLKSHFSSQIDAVSNNPYYQTNQIPFTATNKYYAASFDINMSCGFLLINKLIVAVQMADGISWV